MTDRHPKIQSARVNLSSVPKFHGRDRAANTPWGRTGLKSPCLTQYTRPLSGELHLNCLAAQCTSHEVCVPHPQPFGDEIRTIADCLLGKRRASVLSVHRPIRRERQTDKSSRLQGLPTAASTNSGASSWIVVTERSLAWVRDRETTAPVLPSLAISTYNRTSSGKTVAIDSRPSSATAAETVFDCSVSQQTNLYTAVSVDADTGSWSGP